MGVGPDLLRQAPSSAATIKPRTHSSIDEYVLYLRLMQPRRVVKPCDHSAGLTPQGMRAHALFPHSRPWQPTLEP